MHREINVGWGSGPPSSGRETFQLNPQGEAGELCGRGREQPVCKSLSGIWVLKGDLQGPGQRSGGSTGYRSEAMVPSALWVLGANEPGAGGSLFSM